MLDRILMSDLAFLLPITSLLIFAMIVLFILDFGDKYSRRKQMRLPFDKKPRHL